MASAPEAFPCSLPPACPLALPLPCQRLRYSSAHIALMQLIKTKSKHLLLALSAFLPAWHVVGWVPTSVLLPPTWEGLAAGVSWCGTKRHPVSSCRSAGKPCTKPNCLCTHLGFIVLGETSINPPGEGEERLRALVASALQLAVDKCHRADSLLEATWSMATSSVPRPPNKILAVPSPCSRCLAPHHH